VEGLSSATRFAIQNQIQSKRSTGIGICYGAYGAGKVSEINGSFGDPPSEDRSSKVHQHWELSDSSVPPVHSLKQWQLLGWNPIGLWDILGVFGLEREQKQ
jgi:hypothetical protein